jgi:hypothetical protein
VNAKITTLVELLTGYAPYFVDIFHDILAAWLNVGEEGC